MKKNIVWLIVAVVLLAAMIAALIMLNNAPEATGETESSEVQETIYVTGEASAPMPAEVEISNESGEFSVLNRAAGEETPDLTIKGWEDLSLNTYGINAIASNAASMTAKLVVSESADAEQLATYGLDKPRATVNIRWLDGSATLLLGADAPGGEGVYAKRQDSGTVYLVTQTTADYFLKPGVDYIATEITAADPDYIGFDKIVLSGTNYPEPIVIVRTPETEVSAAGITLHTHTITSPVNVGLHSSVGLEALYTTYGLTADAVADVGDDADTLAKYGLDEPAAVIESTSNGNADLNFTLRISAVGEDGSAYVIKDGSPVIYRFTASTLTWLPLKVFDLMDKMVVVPNINNVSRVTLTTPDKTYVFDLSGEDDDLVVNLNGEKFPDSKDENGKDIDSTRNFRQLYQTMISAKYTEETDLATGADETPIVEIGYVYKDSVGRSPDTLKFYTGPTRKTIMVFNGGKPYLGSSVYLDTLIADAARASEGHAVTAYIG